MPNIDVTKVRGVLLADKVWYEVRTGTFFEVDTYGYSNNSQQIYKGVEKSFRFMDKNGQVTGPLTSVLALRTSL